MGKSKARLCNVAAGFVYIEQTVIWPEKQIPFKLQYRVYAKTILVIPFLFHF